MLPSGLLFTFCGRAGFILDWNTNTWRQPVPRLRGYATTQFPYTGTSVMLGLYPENNYQVWECARAVGGHWAREMVTVSTHTRTWYRPSPLVVVEHTHAHVSPFHVVLSQHVNTYRTHTTTLPPPPTHTH